MLDPCCSGKSEDIIGGAEIGGLMVRNRAEQTGKEFGRWEERSKSEVETWKAPIVSLTVKTIFI